MYTWNQSWLWIWIYYHTKSSITFNLMTLDTHHVVISIHLLVMLHFVIFSPRYKFFFMCKQLEFRWLMPWIHVPRCWIQTLVLFQIVASSVYNSLTGMENAKYHLPAIPVVCVFTIALPTMKTQTKGWRMLLPRLHTTKLLVHYLNIYSHGISWGMCWFKN